PEHRGPITVGNNSSMASEMPACFYDDDAFKYHAYTFSYLLLFPVAFVCNIGALAVFFLQKNRRLRLLRGHDEPRPIRQQLLPHPPAAIGLLL
ncbi:hypothetical protein L3Q82_016439, partial [Scortum barcoo]